jgi:hypothetical protein
MHNVQYVTGDILDYIEQSDYIVHGCNCFHTMGAGVAKALNTYTEGRLLDIDKTTSYGDINKLGAYSSIDVDGKVFYNLYTQHGFGRGGVFVHWESVKLGLINIINNMLEGEVLALPPIGCGLAGGNIKDFQIHLDNAIKFSGNANADITIFVVVK